MNTLLRVTAIACMMSLATKAQPAPPTKIHFLNLVSSLIGPTLKTNLDDKNPIVLKAHTWIIVQTTADSVGFMVNGKAHFIHFDPNQEHYFTLQGGAQSFPVIVEKSRQEFILTASITSAKGPEEYSLGKDSN